MDNEKIILAHGEYRIPRKTFDKYSDDLLSVLMGSKAKVYIVEDDDTVTLMIDKRHD